MSSQHASLLAWRQVLQKLDSMLTLLDENPGQSQRLTLPLNSHVTMGK